MLNELLLCNERVNLNPCVLCNSLFTVTDKETDIKGYWLDKNGKVYIDNIKIEKFFVIDTCYLNMRINTLFSQGEKCVFYKDIYNYGTLRYPDGKWQVLKNRIEIIEYGKPNDKYIAKLLEFHEGLTIYKIDNGQYLIEIYK